MSSNRKADLADPASALASYLDDLLHTATDVARQEEPAQDAVEHQPDRPAPAQPLAAEQPEPVAPPVSLPVKDPGVIVAEPLPVVVPELPVASPEPEPERVTPPEVVPKPAIEPPEAPGGGTPDGRPGWSEQPFECLIFRVAGLQLAVPLILLGAIHRLDEGVKPLPGSPRWYMGILPGKDQNLRVVDSAEWIMAGRVPAGARENYRFVIRLDNSEWALACDDVAQSFTLHPDDVRWRTSRSKRPWLAGTVIKQMCALIDVSTMAQLLADAERDHHLRLE